MPSAPCWRIWACKTAFFPPGMEEGALARGVRVLILPCSVALSDREMAEIERFVRAGGTVLADMQTGLYTEYCAPRETPALDHLFGIQRLFTRSEAHFLDGEYSPAPDFDCFSLAGIDDEEGVGIPRSEQGIRAAGGMRAYKDTFPATVRPWW